MIDLPATPSGSWNETHVEQAPHFEQPSSPLPHGQFLC